MRKVYINIILVLSTLALNFSVFIFSYNKLVFPYLHEAQRMENAPFIFSWVLIGFFLSSVASTITAFYFGRKNA